MNDTEHRTFQLEREQARKYERELILEARRLQKLLASLDPSSVGWLKTQCAIHRVWAAVDRSQREYPEGFIGPL